MTRGLVRYHESRQSHFITFICYDRRPYLVTPEVCNLFLQCLKDMRAHFAMCVYGHVVMPEHVHLLLNEPPEAKLSEAMHYLELSFAKRWHSHRSNDASGTFWQKRYHNRNIRDYYEFTTKLRYLHRNPVKRGLVESALDWKWSSYVIMHCGKRVVQIESEWTARDRETHVTGERIFLCPG